MIYFFILLFLSIPLYTFDNSQDKITFFLQGQDMVYANQKLLAFCNLKTKECKAFDITDSGLAELENAREIYKELKDQHYQLIQQSLVRKLYRRNTQ